MRTAWCRWSFWAADKRAGSGLHRCDELRRAEKSDGALDVVGQDVEAGLGRHVLQPSHLEVAAAHPVLECAEHVLDRSAPDPHGVGPAVEAGLHGVDHLLMLPSLDAAFDAGGAVCPDRAAGAARGRRIAVKRHAVLEAGEASGQRLAGRAAVGVGFGVIDDVLLAEAPTCLGAGGERLGADRGNARLLAGEHFRA